MDYLLTKWVKLYLIPFKGNEPAVKMMQTEYFALCHDRSIHMNNNKCIFQIVWIKKDMDELVSNIHTDQHLTLNSQLPSV